MIASFMAVCILTMGIFTLLGDAVVVEAKTIAQLEKEQKELEKKEKEVAAQLSNNTVKIKDEQTKQKLLSSQIQSVEEQIFIYREKIELVTADIVAKEAEIAVKLEDIDKNEELFAQRVKAMYISNTSSSVLSTLLESKSFSQFINTSEILTRMSDSDQELIDTLDTQKKELQAKKSALETEQTDLKNAKSSFETKNKSLDGLYSQSKDSEIELKKKSKQYMMEKEKYAKQIKENEAEVDRIIAASNNGGAGPQGQLAWPVPSSGRITSPYGWRTIFGKKEFHWGMDIGAGKGTAITSAADGEVILVKKSSYGYGWHVVVNHGGGYSTLYAHASRIDVTQGQQVKRGQTIAGVGNTGNSFGNHLHFEVRINGNKKNPINYVKKP